MVVSSRYKIVYAFPAGSGRAEKYIKEYLEDGSYVFRKYKEVKNPTAAVLGPLGVLRKREGVDISYQISEETEDVTQKSGMEYSLENYNNITTGCKL